MNTGDILVGSGLDEELLAAELHPIDPSRIGVSPTPFWLRPFWGKGVGAMAFPRKVYFRPDLLQGSLGSLGGLVVHELVHVRQWSDYGRWGFLRRYLGEYLRGRRQGLGHRHAYSSNRLELEARRVEERYATPTR